jgi:hypothetical protein
MFVNGSGKIEHFSQRTCHRCFPSSFGSFGQTVSEEKNQPNKLKLGRKHLWKVLSKE